MNRKLKTIAIALIILAAIIPATVVASSQPSLIQEIEIHVAAGESVTLTDVHEYYLSFGHQISLFMPPSGTITFNRMDGPYHPVTGTLYAGVPFAFSEFNTDIALGLYFILSLDVNAGEFGEVKFVNDFDNPGNFAGYHELAWLAINGFPTFESFAEMLPEFGRSLREREVMSPPVRLYDVTPIVPNVSLRPWFFQGESDLIITFTNAYDISEEIGITGMTQRNFYIAPTGTISFNRDVEFTTYHEGEGVVHVSAAAGEVINMSEHTALLLAYGIYEQDEFPYITRRYLFFATIEDPSEVPPLYSHSWEWDLTCGCVWQCRLSNHGIAAETPAPVSATARTLRFVIDSAAFTDNGVSHTLEAAPFIANDRTMVPLRVIIEALGATGLTFEDGVINFVLSGESITMTVGQPLPNNMGTPVIIAGLTFVPLAYIMEEIGATARWDGNARAAYVYIPVSH